MEGKITLVFVDMLQKLALKTWGDIVNHIETPQSESPFNWMRYVLKRLVEKHPISFRR